MDVGVAGRPSDAGPRSRPNCVDTKVDRLDLGASLLQTYGDGVCVGDETVAGCAADCQHGYLWADSFYTTILKFTPTGTEVASIPAAGELGAYGLAWDPVEQVLPGIMQTEVNEARGLTFAKAARHLMRQDPQVLVIGEIRDEETANIAVRAALTGHQVISTLHAGSCSGVLERLLVMCPDKYAVVASLALVFNQRLVRQLCEGCRGEGCQDCLDTGYNNRFPITEWALMDESMRAKVRDADAAAFLPAQALACLLYTSPSPRDGLLSRMPASA